MAYIFFFVFDECFTSGNLFLKKAITRSVSMVKQRKSMSMLRTKSFFNSLASLLIPELLFKHCDFRGMASCSSANSTGVDKGSGVS